MKKKIWCQQSDKNLKKKYEPVGRSWSAGAAGKVKQIDVTSFAQNKSLVHINKKKHSIIK